MAGAFANLRADIRRNHSGPHRLGPARVVRLVWEQPGLQALVAYRLGRWLKRHARQPFVWPLALLLFPLFILLQACVRGAYDIQLGLDADIGPGLYIGHLGGIRLAACTLGRRCAIQQEVRLLPAAKGERGPEIGDEVWIGAHACITGPLTVGAGATISAGSVVTADVAPRCLVLGDPARVIRWDFDNSSFL
jgi:serine O-acetyltransferase